MSDPVPLHKGLFLASEARAAFLQQAAGGFDAYVEAYGHEPDAMIHVYCGLKQTARSGWLFRGESEGGGTSLLALASATLMKDAIS